MQGAHRGGRPPGGAPAVSGCAIWALSLPSTPLTDFRGYDPWSWSPVLLLSGTVVIATVVSASGKAVMWTKVLVDATAP